MPRWSERLVRHQRLVPVIAVLACLPALLGGIELDDVFHALEATTPGFVDSAFTFLGDGPRSPQISAADMPWWTEPSIHMDLWRPLAALTHALDHRLWPGAPWLMHLHSVLWYGLLVALVLRAHRAFGGPPERVSLGALLFGLSQAHGMNVGWVAARNSVIAAVLVVGMLLLHRRWRSEGWRPGALLGPLALAGALLANEGAAAGLGFLVAFAFVLDERRHRFTALVPYLAVIVLWRIVYQAGDYEAVGSGVYLDPATDPLGYLLRTVVHGAIMLAGSLGLAVLDLLGSLPGLLSVAFVSAVPFLALLGWLAREPLRRDPSLRMWTLGAVLACATAGTSLPTDRGLLLLGVGTYPLLAALVLRASEQGVPTLARVVGRGLLVLHVFQSLLLPLRVGTTRFIQGSVDRFAAALPTDPSIEDRALVMLNAPSDLVMLYYRPLAERAGRPFPARVSYLYAGAGEVTVTVVDPSTLELSSTRPWLVAPLDRLLRRDVSFEPGQRVEAPCLTAEIVTTDTEDLPTTVRFELHPDRPGCDPVLMAWGADGPEPATLPEPGESRVLPPAMAF